MLHSFLYSRFWHQVLFDRGHRQRAEPFTKLVNQGMILGEPEYTGFQARDRRVGLQDTRESEDQALRAKKGGDKLTPVKLFRSGREVGRLVHPQRQPADPRRAQLQDVEEPRQRHQPRRRGASTADARLYEMFMGLLGSDQALECWPRGVERRSCGFSTAAGA